MRDDRKDVIAFLQRKFEDRYWIFNLCPRSENEYPAKEFSGRVARFPFPDHYPPPLSLFPLFRKRMADWLDADPQNVGVIHCKVS